MALPKKTTAPLSVHRSFSHHTKMLFKLLLDGKELICNRVERIPESSYSTTHQP